LNRLIEKFKSIDNLVISFIFEIEVEIEIEKLVNT